MDNSSAGKATQVKSRGSAFRLQGAERDVFPFRMTHGLLEGITCRLSLESQAEQDARVGGRR